MTLARTILLASLLTRPALAADPDPAEIDYRGALDQARFQIRKGFLDQAQRDLERAVQHPDGKLDAEPWFLLAQVRLQQGEIVGARKAANKALTYARDPDQQSQSAALVGLLEQSYGLVQVRAVQPGTSWRPRLEPAQPLMDPGQAQIVERMGKRLRKEHEALPQTIGLPVGEWSINGHKVSIRATEPAAVTLSTLEASGGLAAARLAWLEIDLGVMAPLSGEDHLLPSPAVQVGLTVPVAGPWAIGLVGDWTAVAYQDEAGDYVFDATGLQAGVRFGPLLDDGEVVLVRPAIGYRFGGLPGVRLPCERTGATFTCGERPADLILYAGGLVHVPFIEVAADYLDRRRTSGFGAGVRVTMEHAMGRLKEGGKSRTGPPADYSVDQDARSVSRTALRAAFHVSIAF